MQYEELTLRAPCSALAKQPHTEVANCLQSSKYINNVIPSVFCSLTPGDCWGGSLILNPSCNSSSSSSQLSLHSVSTCLASWRLGAQFA